MEVRLVSLNGNVINLITLFPCSQCLFVVSNKPCHSTAYNKQPVEGGPNCKIPEHLFVVNQCYLLLCSRTFVSVEAAVTCSGSQIKGISHQRFPVIFQGPLFGCEVLGLSVLRGMRGTFEPEHL